MELFKLIGSIFVDDTGAKRGLDDTLKRANEVGEKFGEMGGKMTQAGSTIATGVAVATAGLLTLATQGESANVRLQNQLGLTKKEAEEFGKVGKELYNKGFGESLPQVNDAIVLAKQRFTELNDADLSKVTEGGFVIAETFDQDVNEVLNTSAIMAENFGIEGTKSMDLIAVAFQKGGNFSGELLDTMREYSPQFAEMGFSADDMANKLIIGAQNGAFNLDKVGDAFKELNIRAKDGSKSTSEALTQLGFDAGDMTAKLAQGGDVGKNAFNAILLALSNIEDPVERNKIGVALLGTQYEDLEATTVNALASTQNKLGEVDGAVTTMSGNMQGTFGEQLQSAFRTTMEALEPLATMLLELAKEVLPPLIEAVTSAVEWFTNLPQPVQDFMLALTGLLAVIAPLIVIVGQVVTAIGAIIPVITGVVGWFASATASGGVLATVFTALTGPIGIAIAIIGALIAVGVLLYKNWDDIKKYCKIAWDWVVDKTKEAWTFIKDFFEEHWKTMLLILTGALGLLVKYIYDNWDEIKEKTMEIWNNVKDFFKEHWDEMLAILFGVFGILVKYIVDNWDTIKSKTQEVWNNIKQFCSDAWNKLKETATETWNKLKTSIQEGWDNIKQKTSETWNAIKTFLTDSWNAIKTKVTETFNAVKTFLVETWNNVKAKAVESWNAIKTSISDAITNIKSKITEIFNSIKSFCSETWNSIKSKAVEIWNSIKTSISEAVNNVKSKITETWNAIKTTTSSVWKSIKSAVVEPITEAKNKVKEIIDDIVGFFKNIKIPEIKIPKIKMPKFSISGGFSLDPPSVPKLSVDWFKTGGIATGDSIVGIGEAGSEAVLPLEGQYLKPWAKEMSKQLLSVGGNTGNTGTANIYIELDGKQIAKALGQPLTDVIKAKTGIK